MTYKIKDTKKTTVIFLAEDDEDDIFLFEEAMTDTNIEYELYVSKDGNELIQALDQLCPAEPDIVFMDINMPVKNGFESLEQIRKSFANRLFPVFLLSTSTSINTIEIARKLGATGYLSKQVSASRFSSMLRDVLSQSWIDRLKRDFYIRLEYPCAT